MLKRETAQERLAQIKGLPEDEQRELRQYYPGKENATVDAAAKGNDAGGKINSNYNNHITNRGESQASHNQNTDWLDLVPFDQCDSLPPFPLNALPPATREFVHCASETVQAPVDLIGSCVLGVLQIACCGRYPVRLPNGHVERPCFYIAPIGPPSERKSGAIDVCARPLIEYEIEYNQTHGGEVNQSKSELKLLQGRIANAESQAIKEKDPAKRLAAESQLQVLNAELAEFEIIEPLRLFGADVTPEKLAAMLKSQGGVFALVSAEGGGLFENIGRYSDKGGLEIYLNGYSGDRICVDRKSSESIVIDRPTLSLIAPCQPSVISDLFSDRQKSGRGLLSRILFVDCPSRVGKRSAQSKPLDGRVQSNYRNLCYNMLASQTCGNLHFDSEGFEVYCEFFHEIEPQLTPDIGELSTLADWAGKLHGQMVRLAGLIHCISAFEQGKNPLDTDINKDVALAAAALAKYFLAHAKTVYAQQAEPPEISNARYLWGKIKSIKSIGKRDLIRRTQGKKGFSLDDSIAMLIERGYIRVERGSGGVIGRPSETIVVNPETQNIVTKLTLSTKDPHLVNKVTISENLPITVVSCQPHKSDELPFLDEPNDIEAADCPWEKRDG